MARLIDYEQDEEKPFGVGKFKLDDGSDYYLDDPKRARDFLSQFDKESTELSTGDRSLSKEQEYSNAVAKLAEGPNATQVQPGKAFDPKTLDPMRRAVAGPGGGEELSSQPEPDKTASLISDDNMSHSPPEERDDDESSASVRPSDEQLRAQQTAARANIAASVAARTPRTTGVVDPLKMQREGVPVDKSITRKGGMPTEMYGQQAQDRATAYDYTNTTLARHQAEDEARAQAETERLRAEALAQRQSNDQQQLELQRKQTKYEGDRKWLDHEVEDHYDKKSDPDRFFKDRGVFSRLGSAIAQFMGAYASIVSGSPNFANQILDKQIERDIDAQLEDFRRGKGKLDGQLQRMAERGMSLEQMRAALRLQHEKIVEKEAKAASLSEGSRESRQAYEALIAGRQEKFVAEENKFRTEALGETTVQADVVQPKAGRAKTPLELLKEQGDLLAAQNRVGYEAGGGAPQERADERADKRAVQQGKQDTRVEKRLTDYGNRRRELEPAAKEAQDAADKLAAIKEKYGHLPGVGTWDLLGPNTTLGEQRQRFLQAFGVDQAVAAGEVKQLLKTVEGAAVRANKGSQTEGDVSREAEAMMGPNQSEEQVLAGVGRLTKRATLPFDDLNATYSDVLEDYQKRSDQTALDKHKKRKEDKARKSRGEDY